MLLLQAAAFHAPRAFWRAWEGGVVGHLARDLGSPLAPWTAERRAQLLGYLGDGQMRRAGRDLYALRFLGCEFLNFLNAVSTAV